MGMKLLLAALCGLACSPSFAGAHNKGKLPDRYQQAKRVHA
jgi:hypothetical protein